MQDPYAFEKKQRRKIIIMSIIMIVAIIVLVVWGVIAFNRSSAPTPRSDNTQPIVATEDTLPSESATSSSNLRSNSSSKPSASSTSATSSSDLPQSGPADHLPTLALILTSIALFYTNKKIKNML